MVHIFLHVLCYDPWTNDVFSIIAMCSLLSMTNSTSEELCTRFTLCYGLLWLGDVVVI